MKTCFKCGINQSRDSFYSHSGMADGLLGKCKSCTKKDVGIHRSENLEKIRLYDRERGKNKERIKLSSAISAKWRKEDSRRMAAHNAVAKAIKKGLLLKQNCVICNSDKAMAHHESYDKPLDVVWYCQVHHKARHKEMALLDIEV